MDTPPHTPEKTIRILYVDDEPGLLEIGKMFLETGPGFAVDTLTSAGEALLAIPKKEYDAIVSDYQMPEMDRIAFLKEMRSRFGTIPFILFTGRGRGGGCVGARPDPCRGARPALHVPRGRGSGSLACRPHAGPLPPDDLCPCPAGKWRAPAVHLRGVPERRHLHALVLHRVRPLS